MAESTLSFGLYLPPFGPFGNPTVLVDLAVRAEAAGWDGVFLWDHVVTDAMPIADPWTTLGAIANATRRVRIGPMVTPLARRRPWVVGPAEPDCTGMISALIDGTHNLALAARGVVDNFLVEVTCGQCSHEWIDGVRYKDHTLARCPACCALNRVDSSGLSVTGYSFPD